MKMLTKEQKEEIVSYLLNCKIIYISKEISAQKSSLVSRLKKLLEFCDPEKLNWRNIEINVLNLEKQKLTAFDFIDITNKLFIRRK
jgi:hypothetical protein